MLVGTKEGMVLPAPGQGLRSNAMPHDPVTGCVSAAVLVSVAPTRTPRAPSSGVHVLGVALVPGVWAPRWYLHHLRAPGVPEMYSQKKKKKKKKKKVPALIPLL